MTTMTHVDAVNSLASERYLLDEMTEPERDAFEAHVFDCRECAEDVTSGARMKDGVAGGLLRATPVAKVATFAPAIAAPARRAWYQSTLLPWAVAATLAVVVGYQAQRPAITPGAVDLLSPVVLRPASRGAVPSVSLAQSHVAVALDLDAGGATQVAYELRDAAGDVVASGQHPAPAAGVPLLVVIPAFTLTAEQRYSLLVHDAGEPTRTLGEYPFATTR